jgi:hypothetical protein
MRLYIKLFAFILLFVGVQQFVHSDQPSSELWFGFRCEIAYWMNDQPWIERLVTEAGDFKYQAEYPMIVNAAG